MLFCKSVLYLKSAFHILLKNVFQKYLNSSIFCCKKRRIVITRNVEILNTKYHKFSKKALTIPSSAVVMCFIRSATESHLFSNMTGGKEQARWKPLFLIKLREPGKKFLFYKVSTAEYFSFVAFEKWNWKYHLYFKFYSNIKAMQKIV